MADTVAAVFGALYFLVGVIGPFLSPGGAILGIFPANLFHHLFHLVVGGLGPLGAWARLGRWYCRLFGIVFLLLALLGFAAPGLAAQILAQPSVDMLTDNLLHLMTGIGLAYFGFVPQGLASAGAGAGMSAAPFDENRLMRFTRPHRLYLGAVAALAIWVGICCYISPAESAKGIPWSLPPLCATFLGSMYFSGAAFTGLSMRPRRWVDVRVVLPMIAIWTGGLTIVSLFHLPAFDFSRPQVWIWFGAYIIYPLIALWLAWRLRGERHAHPDGPVIPAWAKGYLAGQGTVMMALAVALLFATDAIRPLWPWHTGRLMLQLYSMPLFSYGLGSFILLRQRAWSEIRIGLLAMGIFTGAELAASLRFGAQLDGPAVAVGLWLGWLVLTTAALGALAWLGFWPELALKRARPAARAGLRAAGDAP